VSVDEATRRLLAAARTGGGQVTAAAVESDPWFAAHRELTCAAAHAAATEASVRVGEEADSRAWFPYSFMVFAEASSAP
jgi:hypothetical protein